MQLNVHVRVNVVQPVVRRIELRATDIASTVEELPLQVGDIDHVEVDDADGADAGRSEVQSGWRAESASADDKHACRFEAPLAGEPDAWKRKVAAIAEQFLRSEGGKFGAVLLRAALRCHGLFRKADDTNGVRMGTDTQLSTTAF